MKYLKKYLGFYIFLNAILFSCNTNKEKNPAELISKISNSYYENIFFGVNLPTNWKVSGSDLPLIQSPKNSYYIIDFYKGNFGPGSNITIRLFTDSISANKYLENSFNLFQKSWNPQSKFSDLTEIGSFFGKGYFGKTEFSRKQNLKILSGKDFSNNYVVILELINEEDIKNSAEEISLIENTFSIKSGTKKYTETLINDKNYSYSKDWIHIYDSEDGDSFFVNSIYNKTYEGYTRKWIKQTGLPDNKFELTLQEVNCVENKMKALIVKTYTSSGELLSVISPDEEWKQWPRNTIANLIIDRICQ